jgi:hypothetical protein
VLAVGWLFVDCLDATGTYKQKVGIIVDWGLIYGDYKISLK